MITKLIGFVLMAFGLIGLAFMVLFALYLFSESSVLGENAGLFVVLTTGGGFIICLILLGIGAIVAKK